MAIIKVYSRINWLNKSESLKTPLGKTNLNKMDKAIDTIDNEVVSISASVETLDTTKADKTQLNNMVTNISFNDKNGVISITKYNGTVLNIDTAIEKIAVNFEYNAQTQQLIITLESGEKQYIDMSALVTQYEFKNTDTIAFSVDNSGKVSASVKNGSITKAMLSSEVMTSITLSESNAAASAKSAAQSATNADMDAKLSQSYSVGKSGIRDGEATDNAKYYYEQAKDNAEIAKTKASEASVSENNANTYAKSASTSATASANSAKASATSETNAKSSATASANSAEASANSATSSATSASNAKTFENNANIYAKSARSYALGDTNLRENEDTDNSKYYAKEAEKYAKQAENIAGGKFIPISEKGIAGGVAILNDALAVEKAVADKNGNDISETYATKKALEGKVDNSATGVSEAINKLSEGTSTPTDNDYYIAQYAGGGTTTKTYHRRPVSALWEYIKNKIGTVLGLTKNSYTGNAATASNATKVNNHTVNSDVPANAKFTDTTYSTGTVSTSGLTKLYTSTGTATDGTLTQNAISSALSGKLNINTASGIASCGGNGTYSYFKIATIKITNAYINRPIVFELSGRGRHLSSLTLIFNNVSNADPSIAEFKTNYDNCYWVKKTATSTWEIYGQYNEVWGSYCLHRITGTGADIGVTVNMSNIDALPSGCTQASYGGNVNYASNAGNSATVNGHTVNSNVPSDAKFTDTWRPQPDWNATSGDAVIKNKPTIPSVGNGTVTITQNGASKGTFTMNQSGNTTIALTDNNTTYTIAGLMGSSAKGSTTQPVYWNGSAWANTTYTLGKSVPSNAVFTDTNTWRPVINNLVTTATGSSLDAAQGKVLNDKITTINTSLNKGLNRNYKEVVSPVILSKETYYRKNLPNIDMSGTLLYCRILDSEHCQYAVMDTGDFFTMSIFQDTTKYGWRIVTHSNGSYVSIYYNATNKQMVLYSSYNSPEIGIWCLNWKS